MAASREPFNVGARSPTAAATQPSPWHSPVPYLFGGLAAMLGLIAFALLILACSYWKLSGYLEGGENANGTDPDLEAGDGAKGDQAAAQKAPPVWEDKILVIMAGDAKPTFLATPISSRSSSFGDNNSTTTSTCTCSDKSVDMSKTLKQTGGDPQVQSDQNRDRDTTHEAEASSDQTH